MSKNRQRSALVNFPFPSAMLSGIDVLARSSWSMTDSDLGSFLKNRLKPNDQSQARLIDFQFLMIKQALHGLRERLRNARRKHLRRGVRSLRKERMTDLGVVQRWLCQDAPSRPSNRARESWPLTATPTGTSGTSFWHCNKQTSHDNVPPESIGYEGFGSRKTNRSDRRRR